MYRLTYGTALYIYTHAFALIFINAYNYLHKYVQSVWLNCSDAIWKLLGHQVEAPYEIIDSVYLEVSSFQLCFMFIWIGSRSSPKRTRWFPPRLRRPCGFSWWQICANFHFLGTPIYTRTGGEHDDEAAVVLMIIYII